MSKSHASADGRRAGSARLPLRLLLAVTASCVLGLLFVAVAQAAFKPLLLETNPVSPGASTMPRIRGDADGSVTSVVHVPSLGPVARGAEGEGATVTVFTDSKCQGPVAATGTTHELEGAGILVASPVAPDSETTFYANESDLGGTSACSNGIVYQQVTTPPAPPVFTAVSPASRIERKLPSHDRAARPPTRSSPSTRTPPAPAPPSPRAPRRPSPAPASRFRSPTTRRRPSTRSPRSRGSPPNCSSSAISYQEVSRPRIAPDGTRFRRCREQAAGSEAAHHPRRDRQRPGAGRHRQRAERRLGQGLRERRLQGRAGG